MPTCSTTSPITSHPHLNGRPPQRDSASRCSRCSRSGSPKRTTTPTYAWSSSRRRTRSAAASISRTPPKAKASAAPAPCRPAAAPAHRHTHPAHVVLQQLDTPVICASTVRPRATDSTSPWLRHPPESDTASSSPARQRAIIPESGGTWYLPRLVGWPKRARSAFSPTTCPRTLTVARPREQSGAGRPASGRDPRLGHQDRRQRTARHPRHETPLPPRTQRDFEPTHTTC